MKVIFVLCFIVGCAVSAPSSPDFDRACSPGEQWKDDCNSCFCSAAGPACTKILCERSGVRLADLTQQQSNTRSLTPTGSCKEGDTWQEDCNTCYCTAGKGACTRKLCV